MLSKWRIAFANLLSLVMPCAKLYNISIPYLAGMYILAAQVKPEITPDEFWATALNTGRTMQIRQAGKNHNLGILLDPQALIETLQSK